MSHRRAQVRFLVRWLPDVAPSVFGYRRHAPLTRFTLGRRATYRLLFSSLGVIDKTYLRVFARLTASRESWLSEMRENGQLSEIQAWVVVDILNTAIVG